MAEVDGEVSVKARPILFSSSMVRALIAGTKTQTRRLVKPQPDVSHWQGIQSMFGYAGGDRTKPFGDWHQWRVVGPDYPDGDDDDVWCPWAAGELLWCKESWAYRRDHDQLNGTQLYEAGVRQAWYWADGPGKCCNTGCDGAAGRVRAARFMPRWASRITLRITEVRVQRLQEISQADAIAEGCRAVSLHDLDCASTPPSHEYRRIWESINGADSWAANPFVWCLTFEVLQKNVDEVLTNV